MNKPTLPESWIPDAPGASTGHSDIVEDDGKFWNIQIWYMAGGVIRLRTSTSVKNFIESALLRQFRETQAQFQKPEDWPIKNPMASFIDTGTVRLLTYQVAAFEIVTAPEQDQSQKRKGATLRDHFAAAALQGLLAERKLNRDNDDDNWSVEDYAESAYFYADAMLREREEKSEEDEFS